MSCPKGSVCRLQTLDSLLFPDSQSNLVVRLIAIITIVWRMKKVLKETLDKVNNEELFIPTMMNPSRKSPIPFAFHQENQRTPAKRRRFSDVPNVHNSNNNNNHNNGNNNSNSTSGTRPSSNSENKPPFPITHMHKNGNSIKSVYCNIPLFLYIYHISISFSYKYHFINLLSVLSLLPASSFIIIYHHYHHYYHYYHYYK